MKACKFLLLLLSCVAASAIPIYAQESDCKPPKADLHQTPEEQKASARGYMLACKSSESEDAREISDEPNPPQEAKHGDIQPDEAISDMPATLKDYLRWLNEKSDICPQLVEASLQTVEGLDTTKEKKAFLSSVLNSINSKKKCD